ncbi:MAG TPA: hypothetical protein VJR69_06980 [Nitrospira sp.]|nr:hypothetical protein [Nitrospira sp.]
MRDPSFFASGHCCRHVATGCGAPPALDGTVTAQRMMRRVLLADAGTPVTDLGATPAEEFR